MRILFIILMGALVNSSSAMAQIEETDQKPTIPVTVKMLSELLVERELKAPAEAVSLNSSQLSSEVVGVIKKVHADVGQLIKTGETLLELDSTDYHLAYKQAQANLASNSAQIEQAKLRLTRAKNLSKNNYISADDLLARETDLIVFKAEKLKHQVAIEQAQRNINKTTLKAPFDGVVLARFAQTGSYVSPGMTLFNFVQSNPLEVESDLPMHLSSSISQASNIYFKSGNNTYPVKLLRLSPLIEKGMRTQKARFEFSDQAAPIGASGDLIWTISGGLLPADLVVNRDGKLGVFSTSNKTAMFIPLDNAQEGRPVPINLAPSIPIVVGGRERLQDGDSISMQ